MISISVNAWSKGSGHGAHEDDIFIDWSFPGDKRQKDESLCPARSGGGTTTSTSTSTSTFTSTSTSTSTSTTSSSSSSAAGAGTTTTTPSGAGRGERSGVACVTHTIGQAAGKPIGGVLGASGRLGQAAVRGTLPFTGLPIWAIALAALGLIALGLTLRRRPARRSAL